MLTFNCVVIWSGENNCDLFPPLPGAWIWTWCLAHPSPRHRPGQRRSASPWSPPASAAPAPCSCNMVTLANQRPVFWSHDQCWPIRGQYWVHMISIDQSEASMFHLFFSVMPNVCRPVMCLANLKILKKSILSENVTYWLYYLLCLISELCRDHSYSISASVLTPHNSDFCGILVYTNCNLSLNMWQTMHATSSC